MSEQFLHEKNEWNLLPYLVFLAMMKSLEALTTAQLMHLLSQERKKFLLAIDFGASGSDLEEIRDFIKHLEALIHVRNNAPVIEKRSDDRSSVG